MLGHKIKEQKQFKQNLGKIYFPFPFELYIL